jgi:DNA polymerase-3 subunit chi
MTEIGFYHMTRTSLEAALPQMLEKTLERGQRAVVRAGSAERVEALNERLWTYKERAARQPVWLTETDERPNDAQVLFLTDGAASEELADFERCAVLFDGNDEAALTAARAQWSSLKDAGHELTYWQQNEEGRWEKKD